MKNLRNQSIFTCLSLFVLIPLSAAAVPPPSPAGGNYLALDGVDDHAILDFETFGLLIPKDEDEWTFEAWIYPSKLPDRNLLPIILSQQVRMYVWTRGQHGDFLLTGSVLLARPVAHGVVSFWIVNKVPPNQWYHVALQGEGRQRILIINNFVSIAPGGTTLADDISHAEYPPDFTIGGFGAEIKSGTHGDHFWGHLRAILMRSASQRLRVTVSPKAVSRRPKSAQSSRMTQRQLRCGILMRRGEHVCSQIHQATPII